MQDKQMKRDQRGEQRDVRDENSSNKKWAAMLTCIMELTSSAETPLLMLDSTSVSDGAEESKVLLQARERES